MSKLKLIVFLIYFTTTVLNSAEKPKPTLDLALKYYYALFHNLQLATEHEDRMIKEYESMRYHLGARPTLTEQEIFMQKRVQDYATMNEVLTTQIKSMGKYDVTIQSKVNQRLKLAPTTDDTHNILPRLLTTYRTITTDLHWHISQQNNTKGIIKTTAMLKLFYEELCKSR